MSIVQALETALTEAKTRPELAVPINGAVGRPSNPKKGKGPKPANRPDLGEPDIGVVKAQLKGLAEAIAARNLLSFPWRKKRFGQWSRDLGEVQGLSRFVRLVVELELNLNNANLQLIRWKARRPVWRGECLAAKTIRAAKKLLAELAEVLQIG